MATSRPLFVILGILGCLFCLSSSAKIVPSQMVHRRLLYMEDELLSISRLLMRAERLEHRDGRDIHNITEIKGFLETTRALNDYSLENMSHYTSHPIGIYIITKRLAKEWRDKIDILVKHKMCHQQLVTKLQNIADSMPHENDLEEVTENIIRLQNIYDIKVADLAKGKIMDNMTEPLLPTDCFDIGDHALERGDYLLALEWYNFVLDTCEEQPDNTKLKIRALSKISSVYYRTKHINKALAYTRKILAIDPANKSANRSVKFYETLLKSEKGHQTPIERMVPKTKLKRLFEGVCGGRIQKKASVTGHPDYHCYLRPYFKHGYIFEKIEYVHRNPDMILFRNVTNTKNIRKLLYSLDEKLQKSVMKDDEYTKERHWAILDEDSPRARYLNKKFTKLTNVDWKLSQSTYIVYNFAAGVSESPFVDLDVIQTHGKNSTTFNFFLNDVLAGGDVVFPWLKIKVKPEKGAALFFYNTKPSGKVNKKLQWGECPVLLGDKWAGHKIFREWVNDPPKYGNLLVNLWAED